MVCYGGPVEAPAQMFNEPGFDSFEAAVALLDRELDGCCGLDVYTWNDQPGRTAVDVVATLLSVAARCEAASGTLCWLVPGSALLAWIACGEPTTAPDSAEGHCPTGGVS
jgi:hypothetical protein